MEKIQTILKKTGLTETEIAIYLAGLSYADVSVNELTKQTRIKRTTIYHALKTLMDKGLAAKKGTATKLLFSMTKPENIQKKLDRDIDSLKKQKDQLAEIIPLLAQRQETVEGSAQVSHFEGIEGIKLVIEEALYCKSGHWDIIAPAKNFFSEFDPQYANYFLETRKKRNLAARSLWEKGLSRRALTQEEIKQRKPRYLPETMHGKFKTVIIIFDDKVALVSSLKELTAVLIQSQEIHDTFTAMFEGLWEASEEYRH